MRCFPEVKGRKNAASRYPQLYSSLGNCLVSGEFPAKTLELSAKYIVQLPWDCRLACSLFVPSLPTVLGDGGEKPGIEPDVFIILVGKLMKVTQGARERGIILID